MSGLSPTSQAVSGHTSTGPHSGPDTGNASSAKRKKESTNTAKIVTSAGVASLIGVGFAFRNGLTEGFHSIAGISRKICNLIAIPVAIFYPVILLMNEFNFLKGKNKSNDENKLAKFINPAVSISFATETFCDPLEKATQSPLHMAATLINLPHLLFVLLSYTGGRAMTLAKTIQLMFNPPKDKQLRLEQEADAFHAIGNLGSEHAGIAPLPHLFASGCQNLGALFTGDFGSVFERFKTNPVSTILTFPSIISFIPDYFGKALDTSIRTAEAAKQIQNAFGGSSSKLIRGLEKFKNWWYDNCTKETSLGKFLKFGRSFAKMDKLILAPFSMVAVVCPLLDDVYKLKMFNQEAQEAGGITKLSDTILGPISFFGHLYFTTLYGISVRAPQILVSSIFYGTNKINNLRGAKPGDANYIEPSKIRDKIFNRGIFKWISDKASNMLDKTELELHPDDPNLIKTRTFKRIKVDENGNRVIDSTTGKPVEEEVTVEGKGRSRYIKSYSEIMAEQEAYIPAREEFYTKMGGKNLTDEQWGKVLEDKNNFNEVVRLAKEKFTHYLKTSEQFTPQLLDEFFIKHRKYDEIEVEVKKLFEKEIKASKTKENTVACRKIQIEAKSFGDMFLHPFKYWEDIKNILKLRTFMSKFAKFPLNILGFVNGAEYGKAGESYELRKHQAEEQIIRVHDNTIAVESEFPPVLFRLYENAAKAIHSFAA